MNLSTRFKEGNRYFSRTDADHPYGIGWSAPVPGGNGRQSCRVEVAFRVRCQVPANALQLVFSIERGDEKISWSSIDVSEKVLVDNDWNPVRHLVQVVPPAYTSHDYRITCYVWNSGGMSPLDIDDFEITFHAEATRSFLPPLPTAAAPKGAGFADLYWGPEFSLQYDKAAGTVRILNRKGTVLFDDVRLFTQRRTETIRETEAKWEMFLTYLGDLLTDEGKSFRFGVRNLPGTELRFTVPRDGQWLTVRYEYRVPEYTVLDRQSIVMRSGMAVSAVYAGAGFTVTREFDHEYWLGREGVSWSDSLSRWTIFRPDTVSSLQFDYDRNRIWINVDYGLDHPLLYWPMESESNNYKIDRSSTVLRAGERISCQFRIARDGSFLPLASFTEAPEGREGVFIFTEHADYTVLRSNRAVYFGADTVTSAKDALGGFVAHRIPVTKSVFYTNPDKVSVSDRAGFVSGEIATIKSTVGFREFLADLRENGHEIAMHTPDHFTTNRMILNEAFTSMSKDFRLSTWIDHGYDNGRRSNREDLVCDGFLPGSPMYVAGLFKEFNVQNVWNCFYEDSALYLDATFNAELVTPHPAFGHAYPRPVWWRHPSVTGTVRHFRTTCTLAPRDPSMWPYYLNKDRLRFLAANRGVYVAHVYPARIDSVPAFYQWDQPVWTVQPSFDEALKVLSDFRDEGRLWITTVREYLDYASARDALVCAVTPAGQLSVHNAGGSPIRGLSLSVRAADVEVPGKTIGKRKSGEDLLFWFDLSPSETVTVLPVQ
jgi:hypothetical protein